MSPIVSQHECVVKEFYCLNFSQSIKCKHLGALYSKLNQIVVFSVIYWHDLLFCIIRGVFRKIAAKCFFLNNTFIKIAVIILLQNNLQQTDQLICSQGHNFKHLVTNQSFFSKIFILSSWKILCTVSTLQQTLLLTSQTETAVLFKQILVFLDMMWRYRLFGNQCSGRR